MTDKNATFNKFNAEQDLKHNLFIKMLDSYNSVKDNIAHYLRTEGEQNSLYSVFMSDFSQNPEKLRSMSPAADSYVNEKIAFENRSMDRQLSMLSPEDRKYEESNNRTKYLESAKRKHTNQFINDNPAEVVTLGILNAVSSGMSKKVIDGKISGQDALGFINNYVGMLAAPYSFDETNKENEKTFKETIGQAINMAVVPTKISDGVYGFKYMGEVDGPVLAMDRSVKDSKGFLASTDAGINRAWTSGKNMIWELGLYRLIGDVTGTSSHEKYNPKIQSVLESTPAWNWLGQPVREDGTPLAEGEVMKPMIETGGWDTAAFTTGTIGGTFAGMAIDQILACAVTATTGPVGGVAAEGTAIASTANRFYRGYGVLKNGILGVKSLSKMKPLLGAGFKVVEGSGEYWMSGITMANVSTMQELGTQGTTTGYTLLGNNDQDAKTVMIAGEWVQNFVSATVSNYLGDAIFAKTLGKAFAFDKVAKSKEFVSAMEKTGASRAEALAGLSKAGKLEKFSMDSFIKNGGMEATTKSAVNKAVRSAVGETAAQTAIRNVVSGFIGKSVVEMTVDGIFDFTTITSGNYLSNKATGKNMFSVNTTNMGDLAAGIPFMDQLSSYVTNQGMMRVGGQGLRSVQEGYRNIKYTGMPSISKSAAGVKEYFGLDRDAVIPVGATVDAVKSTSIIKAARNKIYDDIVSEFKFDEDPTKNIVERAIIGEISKHIAVSKIADDNSGPDPKEGILPEARRAISDAVFESDDMQGRLVIKGATTQREDVLSRLSDMVLRESLTGEGDAMVLDKDLLSSNIRQTFYEMNLNTESGSKLVMNILDRSRSEYNADVSTRSAVKSFLSGEVLESKVPAKVSRKSLLKEFPSELTEFDAEKVITDNLYSLKIMDKVKLGIDPQQKEIITAFVKQVTAQSEVDVALQKTLYSGNEASFKKNLDLLSKHFKLGESDIKLINELRASVDSATDKNAAMEIAKARLITETTVFDEADYRTANAINSSISTYVKQNANKWVENSVNAFNVDHEMAKQHADKLIDITNVLRPFLSEEAVHSVNGLGMLVKGIPEAPHNLTNNEYVPISNTRSNVELLFPREKQMEYGLHSTLSDYGLKTLPKNLFTVRTNSKEGYSYVNKTSYNEDAFEFITKTFKTSDKQLGPIFATAAIKNLQLETLSEGKIDEVVPMFEMYNGKYTNVMYAHVVGRMNEKGMSELDVTFKIKANTNMENLDIDAIDPKDDIEGYLVSNIMPVLPEKKPDGTVVKPDEIKNADLNKNKHNAGDFLYATMKKASDFSKEAESLRHKVNFDKWIFNIGDTPYTLKTFKEDLNESLSLDGMTVNSAVNTMLRSYGNVDDAVVHLSDLFRGMVKENGKTRTYSPDEEELINIASRQIVWEAANKHGLNTKLEIAMDGNIRKFDIRADITNTYHNNRICEVDIEYDLDADIKKLMDLEIGAYDAEVMVREEFEDKLVKAGLVKLPMGFGNNLKTKWLYLPDFGNATNDLRNLKSIMAESIADRRNLSLYPEGDNVYAELSKNPSTDNKSWSKYFHETFTRIIDYEKGLITKRIADFESRYADVLEAHTVDGKIRGTKIVSDGIEISAYTDHTNQLLKSNQMTNDVIVEMYLGMKSSLENLDNSRAAVDKINEYARQVDANAKTDSGLYEGELEFRHYVRGLVSRFALFGAETFSISNPAKRGSFALLTNKIDNTGDEQNVSKAINSYVDDLIANKGRLIFVQSRTQDGMSWLPKKVTDIIRSVCSSFDIKYTNQALGSKLMTTDTARIAGETKILTQMSDEPITVRDDDYIIEFGSIKGYSADLAHLFSKVADKSFKGNGLQIDMSKLDDRDKLAIRRLIGNTTTHAVLTTNSKDAKVSTQSENTTPMLTKTLLEMFRTVSVDNVRKVVKHLRSINVKQGYVSPAMVMREFAAAFGSITVPGATGPAEVMTKLRDQDFKLADDDSVPFQKVLGTKALSVDMMYFIANDKSVRGRSSNLGKLADWLGTMSDNYKPTEEELAPIRSLIIEMDPKYNLKPGEAGIHSWIMDFLSNETMKNKTGRMYAKVGEEYYSLGNRSPLVYAGQQDFFLIRGIRKGGQGIEMSAEAYSKIEGGDYDGDTVGRLATSMDVIKKTIGLDGFKETISTRQRSAIEEVKMITEMFSGVKPPKDYFDDHPKLNSIPIDKWLGALKKFQMSVFSLGVSDKVIAEKLNNPKSNFFIYDKLALHDVGEITDKGERDITAMESTPIVFLFKPTKTGLNKAGNKCFFTNQVMFSQIKGKESDAIGTKIMVEIVDNSGTTSTVKIYKVDENETDYDSQTNKVKAEYQMSSIRGMNHIIQSMSVSNAKTSSVQYLNEQVAKYSEFPETKGDPSKIMSTYIYNLTSAIGMQFGKDVEPGFVNNMATVMSAFSVEKDMSTKKILQTVDALDRLAELDEEYMPASVSMALLKWNIMKEAGLDKVIRGMFVSKEDLDNTVASWFHGKEVSREDLEGYSAEFRDVKTFEELKSSVLRELVGSKADEVEAIKVLDAMVPKDPTANKIPLTGKDKLPADYYKTNLKTGKTTEMFAKAKDGSYFINDAIEGQNDGGEWLANTIRSHIGVKPVIAAMNLTEKQFFGLMATNDIHVRKYLATKFLSAINRTDGDAIDKGKAGADAVISEAMRLKGYKTPLDVPGTDMKLDLKVNDLIEHLSKAETASTGSTKAEVLRIILNKMDDRSKLVHDMLASGWNLKKQPENKNRPLSSEFKSMLEGKQKDLLEAETFSENFLLADDMVKSGLLIRHTKGYEVVSDKYTVTDEDIINKYGRAVAAQNKNGVITLNRKLMQSKFDNKSWTKPPELGDGTRVKALPEDAFKTFDEFKDFVVMREMLHNHIHKTENESIGEYETRINDKAFEMLDYIKDVNSRLEFNATNDYSKPIVDHKMSYAMKADENLTGKSTTTIDLIEAGLRTASTRSYKLGEIGDRITFEGRPTVYEITKVEQLTKENTTDPDWIKEWSNKEQWTESFFKSSLNKTNTVKVGSYQTTFKKVESEPVAEGKVEVVEIPYDSQYRKGSPVGDAKDVAMRKVADGFIGEIAKKTGSSSLTSATEILKADPNAIIDAAYMNKGTIAPDQKAKVIMLARNSSISGDINSNTKKAILEAHNNGSTFVVGDKPGTDGSFIKYLNDIGASYKVYHTSDTGNRSAVLVKTTEAQPTKTEAEPAAVKQKKITQPVVPESKYMKLPELKKVGKSVEFTSYDRDGSPLVRKGYVVQVDGFPNVDIHVYKHTPANGSKSEGWVLSLNTGNKTYSLSNNAYSTVNEAFEFTKHIVNEGWTRNPSAMKILKDAGLDLEIKSTEVGSKSDELPTDTKYLSDGYSYDPYCDK